MNSEQQDKNLRMARDYLLHAEELEERANELRAKYGRVIPLEISDRISLLRDEASELRVIGHKFQKG